MHNIGFHIHNYLSKVSIIICTRRKHNRIRVQDLSCIVSNIEESLLVSDTHLLHFIIWSFCGPDHDLFLMGWYYIFFYNKKYFKVVIKRILYTILLWDNFLIWSVHLNWCIIMKQGFELSCANVFVRGARFTLYWGFVRVIIFFFILSAAALMLHVKFAYFCILCLLGWTL